MVSQFLKLALPLLALSQSALAKKAGVTWAYYNDPAGLDISLLTPAGNLLQYMYNYETYLPKNVGGLNFIGMQRCYPTCDSSPVEQLATRQTEQGWTHTFSVNEPDISNSNATEVAAWYKQYINPLTTTNSLPAISNSAMPGQGVEWLNSFIAACEGGCIHDSINVHWYGGTFAEFQAYINDMHTRFPDTSVAITEFALSAPQAPEQLAFFKEASVWLESLPWVNMYFPFVATSPSLLAANDPNAAASLTGMTMYNDDLTLSPVGQYFATGV